MWSSSSFINLNWTLCWCQKQYKLGWPVLKIDSPAWASNTNKSKEHFCFNTPNVHFTSNVNFFIHINMADTSCMITVSVHDCVGYWRYDKLCAYRDIELLSYLKLQHNLNFAFHLSVDTCTTHTTPSSCLPLQGFLLSTMSSYIND